MSQRLMKEFRDAQQSKDKDIKLTVQDNLYKWTAYLQGPEGTPFEGGCFQVLLDVQESYPLQAPKARFITRIFHPNIHFKTGESQYAALYSRCSPLRRLTALSIATLEILSALTTCAGIIPWPKCILNSTPNDSTMQMNERGGVRDVL